MSEIPRRLRLDLASPAELAIHIAIQEIEKLPADIRLTDAQIKLMVIIGVALKSMFLLSVASGYHL